MLKVVAGTAHEGEGPSVFDAPDGADRCLRAALRAQLKSAVIVGVTDCGEIEMFSNILEPETVIGTIERAKVKLVRFADMASEIQPPCDVG